MRKEDWIKEYWQEKNIAQSRHWKKEIRFIIKCNENSYVSKWTINSNYTFIEYACISFPVPFLNKRKLGS